MTNGGTNKTLREDYEFEQGWRLQLMKELDEANAARREFKETLLEIERNCAPWAKVDNMAGRISGIIRAALARADERRT